MKGKVELSKVGYGQLKLGHMFLMANSIPINVWWYKPSPIITHLWYFTRCFPIWKLPSRKCPIFGDINHPPNGESHENSHRIRAFGAAWICLPKRAARPLANWFWCSSLVKTATDVTTDVWNEALGGFTHDFPWHKRTSHARNQCPNCSQDLAWWIFQPWDFFGAEVTQGIEFPTHQVGSSKQNLSPSHTDGPLPLVSIRIFQHTTIYIYKYSYIYIYIHMLQLNIGVASFTSSIANLR